MKNRVQIYTDGACSNNHLKQNTGGYGAIILRQGKEPIKLNGGYRNTTNNRMELKAVIEALKTMPISLSITVYSDSQYVVRGINEWIYSWIKKGKIEKNGDLWMELYRIVITFSDIQFMHVKGHSGNKYNEVADSLATKACRNSNLPFDNERTYTIG